jgi:hypothetical protein
MRVSGHLLGQAALPPGKQFPVLCPHWIGGSVGLRGGRARPLQQPQLEPALFGLAALRNPYID